MCNLIRIALALVAALFVTVDGAHAQSYNDVVGIVQPIGAGRYPVGCSNIEQDFSRVASGSDAPAYWEGRGGNGSGYVTDLLRDPAHALVVDVTLPDDRELYGDFRNRTLSFGTLVCYPTSAANGRADYPLPTGKSVPHMQRGAESPIFADDRERFPVLLFSHGLGGSPISSDYIDALKIFASQGYVAIAPFHGDSRITNVRLDSFDDLVQAILNFSNYTAMQAIRPQTLRAALDAVLADPSYAARIDPDRIGGFGGSLGGESLLLMRGARLTISPGLSSKAIMNDTRLKAAVGYVPYFGQPLLPAFGREQEGLENVDLPYLAIAGSEDITAPRNDDRARHDTPHRCSATGTALRRPARVRRAVVTGHLHVVPHVPGRVCRRRPACTRHQRANDESGGRRRRRPPARSCETPRAGRRGAFGD